MIRYLNGTLPIKQPRDLLIMEILLFGPGKETRGVPWAFRPNMLPPCQVGAVEVDICSSLFG